MTENTTYNTGRIEGKLDLLLEHNDRIHQEQKDMNAKLLAIEQTKASKQDVDDLEERLATVESFKARAVGAITLLSVTAGAGVTWLLRKLNGT